MLVSSFKDMEKIDITQIRKIYRTLSNLCNMNVLKVLVAFFENNNNGLSDNGLTVAELSKMTHLTVDQVYEAMNNLDVIINDKANDERWFVTHIDTIPLLKKEDLSYDVLPVNNKEYNISNVKVLHHNYPTNKIAYIRVLFDVKSH